MPRSLPRVSPSPFHSQDDLIIKCLIIYVNNSRSSNELALKFKYELKQHYNN